MCSFHSARGYARTTFAPTEENKGERDAVYRNIRIHIGVTYLYNILLLL